MQRVLIALLISFLFIGITYASEDECRRGHDECGNDNGNSGGAGGDGGDGGDGGSGGDTSVDVSATGTGEGGEGGDGGSAQVSTSNESSSIVLTGARDTAQCFTKIGVGAEGFGVFWSRSDSFCKKVRLIAANIERGNYSAAARLECTLKEWEEVYGHRNTKDPGYEQCLIDITVIPDVPPPNLGQLYNRAAREAPPDMLIADVTEEEYREQQQEVEYRQVQQETVNVKQAYEIERLRKESSEIKKEQEEQKVKDEERRAYFQKILDRLEQKEESK